MPDARRLRVPYITHTFRGRRYKVAFADPGGDCDGLCGAPLPNQKVILIAPHLRGKKRLQVILHECQHACQWDLDEEAIDEISSDITELIWLLGYRMPDDKEDRRRKEA